MELSLDDALKRGIKAHKTGKVQEADKLYTSILQLQPNHPDANHNMGVLAVDIGKPQEALPFFRTAIEARPDVTQFYTSYIDTLIKLERLGAAETFLDLGENTIAKVVAYNNLGAALESKGDRNAAIENYRKAIKIKPNFPMAYFNLGKALQVRGDLEAAIENYRETLKLVPKFSEALNTLGIALNNTGDSEAAIENYRKALEVNPNYSEAKMNLDSALKDAVPTWHLSMMKDETRNQAYLDAMQLAISEDDFVLDIGTGSGLLSMMAAKIGAKEVVTCESSKTIAEVAKEIIHKNGYSRKIKVINKNSTELMIKKDIPRKANVVVSEILSAEFVGEGVRSTILDAKKRLLNDKGKMIPESGNIRIALLESSAAILEQLSAGKIGGFDLSSFDSISGVKSSLNLPEKPNLLSLPIDAFKIDLHDTREVTRQEKVIRLKAIKSGLCWGVIQWIKVQLFEDIEYENFPGEVTSHWPTPIYTFKNPVEVVAGQILEIRAALFEDAVWFDHN